MTTPCSSQESAAWTIPCPEPSRSQNHKVIEIMLSSPQKSTKSAQKFEADASTQVAQPATQPIEVASSSLQKQSSSPSGPDASASSQTSQLAIQPIDLTLSSPQKLTNSTNGPEAEVDVPAKVSQMPTPLHSQAVPDHWAFYTAVEADKDHISNLPAETLDQIFGYAIIDHDPDRAVKKQQGVYDHRHVLLSLSAMSRLFRQRVDAFSESYLTKHRSWSKFRQSGLGKYWRLKVNHRIELVKALQTKCFRCAQPCKTMAPMANRVALHDHCQQQHGDFAPTIVSPMSARSSNATISDNFSRSLTKH